MELSEFIRSWRKAHGYTVQEFANKAGLTKGFISQLENDFRHNKGNKKMMPSLESIKKLANACDMSVTDFINAIDTEISLETENIPVKLPFPEAVRSINIYNPICCGNGLFTDDEIIETVTVPVSMLPNKSAEYFGQHVSGDSMTGAGIEDGDLIIFKKTSSVENGQIGCFCIDENVATCKKFHQGNGMVLLLPANDKYDPIQVDPMNECFRVIGTEALLIKKRGR